MDAAQMEARPSLAERMPAWIDRWVPPAAALWIFAGLVGLATGIGAVLFIRSIDLVSRLLFETLPRLTGWPAGAWVVIAPVAGGLVAGPIIAFFASEAKGHGVPEVMQAMALRGGRIRPQVVVGKVLASAACIGSGGSAGREGPIVQVGAAIGSSLGQFLHQSESRLRNLVACGAAAGIAATFNAPIAGVMFSIEIILGEWNLGDLGSVVISAVTASTLARSLLGDRPAFAVPRYGLGDPLELILFLLLGAACALAGVGFIKLLYRFEDLFDGWKFPGALKPAVGGLALGALGWLSVTALADPLPGATMPRLYAAGFGTIEAALRGNLPLVLLVGLLLLKPVATSLTLGSGNSGGVFAPALFTGAMLGGAFGAASQALLPGLALESGAYAAVGMAGVFAAAARAPLTAMLIVFEMTDDYRMILPLMAGVVTATALARAMHSESIYTLKLARRGIQLSRGRDVDILDSVRVDEVMRTRPATVAPDLAAEELSGLFLQTNSHAFPVLDSGGNLVGMVSLEDVRRATAGGKAAGELRVIDLATRALVVAYPRETMRAVLRKMAPRDLSRLPVVDPQNPRRLLGVVRRNDVVRAYELGTLKREQQQAMGISIGPGAVIHDFEVGAGHRAVGKALTDLRFPPQCRVVSVLRGGRTVVPGGGTQLALGDRLRVLVVDMEPGVIERLLRDGGLPEEGA